MKKETSVLELVINGKQAQTSINGLTNSIKTAEREFRKMREADDPVAYRQSANAINEQKKALAGMRSEIAGVAKETTGWKDIAKGVAAGFGIQAAIGMVIDFGKQVLETTAKFQKLEAVLTTTLGSKSAAKLAMQQIQEFASKTPFSVDELTSSFVKLANQGFRPTQNQMRMLGDLAASTGKSFDQLTEGIIDAQVGEFERLKEFGVRAKKEGDNVTFTFRGVETQVKNTDDAIRGYIVSLGDLEGISGSMAGISETLGGKISNLGDAWDQLLVTVGDETAGVFSGAISLMSSAIDTVTQYLQKLNLVQKYGAEGGGFWERVGEAAMVATRFKTPSGDIAKNVFSNISKDLDERIGNAKNFRELIEVKDDLDKRIQNIDKSTQQGAAAFRLYTDKLKMVADAANGLKKTRVEEAFKKQTAAQKEASQALTVANKKAADELEKNAKQREKDVIKLKEDLQKEFNALDLTQMDGLSKLLAEIANKYNPLIQKAKELNDVDLLKQANLLKKIATDDGVKAFNKADAEKQKKTDFDAAKTIIENDNTTQKIGLANEDLTPEERAQKEYDLETERLLSLQMLYRAFDESSLEYDQALADRKVAIKQKEVEDKQALAALMMETEIETQLATSQAVEAGAALIAGFLEQGSAAYKAFIMVEKIAAISQIIINLQKQISGIMTAAFLNPAFAADPTGVARAAFIAKNVAVAKITAGIGIATVGAQAVGALTAKKVQKKAKGGFISDGPSHSEGGMKVLGRDGNVVAEIEGGEPILSRDTYRNNKETIDALLYSSQRMSGARVNFNSNAALTADRYFRSGGMIAPPEWKQNVSVNNSTDMKTTNELLMTLIDKVQNQEVKLSLRMLEEEQAKRAAVINGASA